MKVAAQPPQAVGGPGRGPHRARRRWRPGAVVHWVPAPHGSGGGAAADQGREVVDELQRGEGQRGGPVALGLGQAIEDPLIVDLFDALKGEGRAGAIAQQPFQSGPVVAGDAHASVEREAAVVPHKHVAGVIGIEQAVAGEPVEHAAADLLSRNVTSTMVYPADTGSRFSMLADDLEVLGQQ